MFLIKNLNSKIYFNNKIYNSDTIKNDIKEFSNY